MVYAKFADYAAQYPSSTAEQSFVELLLEQATDAIDMAFAVRGRTAPNEAGDPLLLKVARRVCCQLANRQAEADSTGLVADATQASWTAGQFTQSYTLPGNGSNLRLNSADLAALGLGGGSFGFSCAERPC